VLLVSKHPVSLCTRRSTALISEEISWDQESISLIKEHAGRAVRLNYRRLKVGGMRGE
jgi:hypothetical protein